MKIIGFFWGADANQPVKHESTACEWSEKTAISFVICSCPVGTKGNSQQFTPGLAGPNNPKIQHY
jgi:hypothetical protein